MSRADNARKLQEQYASEKKQYDKTDRAKLNYLSWKDKETKTLRILPLAKVLKWYLEHDKGEYDEDAFPFTEFWQHWNVGVNKVKVACLKKHNNEPCPICEEIEELKATGDTDDFNFAKSMWAGGRFAWFAIDRDDEEDIKWFVWECSGTVNDTLLSKLANTKIPDLDHVFSGTDIEVTRRGAKDDPKTRYDIEDVREESYLYTTEDGEFDYERAERLLEVLPCVLDHKKPFLNYEETKAVMEGVSFSDVLKARYENTEENVEESEAKPSRGRGRGRGRK